MSFLKVPKVIGAPGMSKFFNENNCKSLQFKVLQALQALKALFTWNCSKQFFPLHCIKWRDLIACNHRKKC